MKKISLETKEKSLDEYGKAITAIERIRALVGSNELDLPQICVIGNQSSGKSTLLGKLVDGLDRVLPQGGGTVTRCPIVIRLVKIDESKENKVKIDDEVFEWNENGQDLAQKRINNAQNLQTAKRNMSCDNDDDDYYYDEGGDDDEGVGFSSKEIHLTVFHRDVHDLVLVDLPGLISNANDKKVDFVSKMAMKAIKNPQSFILVVHVADQDFESALARKMARDVDPSDERTLVVFTKCDNFSSPSTEKAFRQKMQDKDKYFGVCCNKKGNDEVGRLIGNDAAEEEKNIEFYQEFTNFGFTRLFNDRLPPLLAKLLKKNLPMLHAQISSKLKEANNTLDKVGVSEPSIDSLLDEVEEALRSSVCQIEEFTTKEIRELNDNLIELGKTRITESEMKEKIKPNAFYHSSYQGSSQFQFEIKRLAKEMIQSASSTFSRIIAFVSEKVENSMANRKEIRNGLVKCWGELKVKLEEKIREEEKHLKDDTEEYNSYDDIVGLALGSKLKQELESDSSQSELHRKIPSLHTPKMEVGASNLGSGIKSIMSSAFGNISNAEETLCQNLTRYYKEMVVYFVKRVFSITRDSILKKSFLVFINDVRRNENFKDHCKEDPTTSQIREENLEIRDNMIKCQLELQAV